MKRKLVYLLLLFCLVLPFGITIVACSGSSDQQTHVTDKRIELTRNRMQYSGPGCYYNGEPQTLDLTKLRIYCNGNTVDNSFFTFEYANNINVTTDDNHAILIITCKDNNPIFKGTYNYEFNIYRGQGSATTLEQFKQMASSGNYSRVDLSSSITIPAGDTVTVAENTSIRVNQMGTVITNSGTFVNNGNVNIIASSCKFINLGSIENNNSISVSHNSSLFTGNYSGTGTISNYGDVYCDDTLVGGITNRTDETYYSWVGHTHVRTNINDTTINEITVDGVVDGKVKFIYGQTKFDAAVSVNGVEFHAEDGTKVFSDNATHPTTDAYVTITAYDDCTKFYGSTQCFFEIIKGQADVADFDALIDAQNTGCFDTYTIDSSITIPNNTTFTLAQDETLIVSGNIIINGTLINNGSVTCTTVTISNSCTNNGSFSVNSLTCSNGATLVVGSTGTTTISTTLNVNGLLNNSGNITTDSLQYNMNYVEYSTNIGITNSGSISISGQSRMKALNLQNTGTFANSGTINLVTEYETFTNTGTFTNLGTIYGFEDNILTGVSSGVQYRKYITTDLSEYNNNKDKYVYAHLDETEFYYNTHNQFPNIIITQSTSGTESSFTLYPKVNGSTTTSMLVYDNAGLTNRRTDYYIGIVYDNQNLPYAGDEPLASAGDLQFKLNTDLYTNLSCALKPADRTNRLILNYSIQRVQKTITTSSMLQSLLLNGQGEYNQNNYNVLSLSASISLTSYSNSTLTIENHCTLYIGAHTLEIAIGSTNSNAYIANYGKIQGVNSSVLSLKQSTINGTKTTLYNYGLIEDVGKIILEADRTKLENNAHDGIIKTYNTVNPKIYTFESTINGFIPDGTSNASIGRNIEVYTRVSLDYLKNSGQLTLQYNSTPYTGTNRTPTMYLNNVAITDTSVFSQRTYSNNLNAGTASVSTSVVDEYNTNYYGSTTLTFTIERIESTLYAISQSTIDSRNYSKITLGQNITLSSNLTLGDYGLILDMSIYNFVNSGSNNYRVTCTDSCRILASINSADRYEKYGPVADKITFVDDVKNTNLRHIKMRYDFSSFCDAGDPGRIFTNYRYNYLEIDYNGYDFWGQTNISFNAENTNQHFTVILTSSGQRSSLGASNANNFALIISKAIDSGNKAPIISVDMSNLTVCGCSAPFNPYGSMTINAHNTIFDASGTTDNNYAYAFRLWGSGYLVGVQSTTTITNYEKLTVTIDSVDNVINQQGKPNGIYIQHT